MYFILSAKKHKTQRVTNHCQKDNGHVNRHFTMKEKIGNKNEKTSTKKCKLKSIVRCYFSPISANI